MGSRHATEAEPPEGAHRQRKFQHGRPLLCVCVSVCLCAMTAVAWFFQVVRHVAEAEPSGPGVSVGGIHVGIFIRVMWGGVPA